MMMKIEISKYKNIKYAVSYPDGYTSEKKYPVIIFLHGAGTRGDDISVLTEDNAFYSAMKKYDSLGFVTVAPLCGTDTWFDIFTDLIEMLEVTAINAEFTDTERVYCMGASMGGYGTWQLAMSRPEWFAAIVPICGGGMYWNAARLKHIPVWAFHGDIDPTVDVTDSIKMTDAVNHHGGSAKLTVYSECGHDAWTATYNNEGVFKWLLSHTNHSGNSEKTDFSDAKIYG